MMNTVAEIKLALETLAQEWDEALRREFKVDEKYKHVKAEELRELIGRIEG